MEKIQKVQVLLRWLPNILAGLKVLSNKTGISLSVHSQIAVTEYLARHDINIEEPKAD
jgi:hypothetical protein